MHLNALLYDKRQRNFMLASNFCTFNLTRASSRVSYLNKNARFTIESSEIVKIRCIGGAALVKNTTLYQLVFRDITRFSG